MAEVKGVGGVFIESDDAARLAAWYSEALGIQFQEHPDGQGFYRVFETRDRETSIVRANPVFAIHPSPGKLATEGRGFVVNLRVDDLADYLDRLQAHGASARPIEEHPYGLFSGVVDPDGNRIELYEERFPES